MAVEESKSKILKKLRNSHIENLFLDGFSIKSIAYIFNLSEGQIKNIIPTNLQSPQSYKQCTLEDLEQWRSNFKVYLKRMNLTSQEISYVFNQGSLVKDEEIENLKSQINQLVNEKSSLTNTLKAQIQRNETLETQLRNQDSQIQSLESDLSSSLDKMIDIQRKLTDSQKQLCNSDSHVDELSKKIQALQLELATYKNNKTSSENVSELKRKYDEKIQRIKDNVSVYKQEQKEKVDGLEADLVKKQMKVDNLSSILEKKQKELDDLLSELNKKNSQIESLTNRYEYMHKQTGIKHKKVQELLCELNDLKSQLDSIQSEQNTPSIDTKYKRVYDREFIKSVYISHNYVLKDTLTSLHDSGVNISYRHLSTILQEEQVYKKTYRKNKKKSKKT